MQASVAIEDLGEAAHVCKMCEVIRVRHVHEMQHPDYPETLRVGCVCAGHMEENLIGARRREAAFKNGRQRRARWLSREWRVSAKGNEYLNTDGFNVVIYPKWRAWAARVENRVKGGGSFHGTIPDCQRG